jgi:hypothetical protein
LVESWREEVQGDDVEEIDVEVELIALRVGSL